MPEVPPTRSDPALHAGSEWLGGPYGNHALPVPGFWTPLRVILAAGTVVFWLGFLRTYPCMSNGWLDPDRYESLCYSDVPVLYQLRDLADGVIPDLGGPTAGQLVEDQVLIGAWTWILAKLTHALSGGPDVLLYYRVSAVAAFAAFLVAVTATSIYVKGRIWDGLLLALAPAVALASFVSWDWPAIALTALSLLAWSRARPVWAGVLLGLAISAKFYPVLVLGPLLLLCLRRRDVAAMTRLLAGTVASWLLVNVSVMLVEFEDWKQLFTFSSDSGEDFGSVWFVLTTASHHVSPEAVNRLAILILLVLCVGIGALCLFAPTPPRIAQVSFLAVAAFLLTNKVYSPQFVLWLLPLAIIARPRWRDIVWWQVAEAVYFVAVWWYLAGFGEGAKGLSQQWYAVAIMVHVLATLILAGIVVRDILWPGHDPVRRGNPEDPGWLVTTRPAAVADAKSQADGVS